MAAFTLALTVFGMPLPATAQAEMSAQGPACATVDADLPAALASWPAKVDVVSAVAAADLSKAVIVIGQAARVSLHGTREVTYPVQPEKPGGSVAHGGLLAFSINQPGAYRVALSTGAWIDVIRDGQPQRSTAHGHGPACSTIRKMVNFNLQPGHYILQISANADAEISVLVTPAP
jgi:hypothetical protein